MEASLNSSVVTPQATESGPIPAPAGLPAPCDDPKVLLPGPRIKRISNKKAILKHGHTVKATEAEAIRFVGRMTTIPVPCVYDFYQQDDQGYLLMSEVEGRPLGEVWLQMSAEARERVTAQVHDYIAQLQSIKGQHYGALGPSPSEDIFFRHLPFFDEEKLYGPYYNADQYASGLMQALENSRPPQIPTCDDEEKLVESIRQVIGTERVFSHGDLHPNNVLVNEDAVITGIIDWESAGFSFPQREYVEVKLRVTPGSHWETVLDTAFPAEFKDCLPLFKDLEQRLVYYTGF